MKTVLFQQVTKPTLTQTQQPQGKIGYTKFGLRILLAGFSFGLQNSSKKDTRSLAESYELLLK